MRAAELPAPTSGDTVGLRATPSTTSSRRERAPHRSRLLEVQTIAELYRGASAASGGLASGAVRPGRWPWQAKRRRRSPARGSRLTSATARSHSSSPTGLREGRSSTSGTLSSAPETCLEPYSLRTPPPPASGRDRWVWPLSLRRGLQRVVAGKPVTRLTRPHSHVLGARAPATAAAVDTSRSPASSSQSDCSSRSEPDPEQGRVRCCSGLPVAVPGWLESTGGGSRPARPSVRGTGPPGRS